MFGYITYWSGSLLLAIILHLLYNSSQLFLVYLHPHTIEQNINIPNSNSYLIAMIGFCIAIGISYWFSKSANKRDYYFISPKD